MKLLSILAEKPWLTTSAEDETTAQAQQEKIALIFFMLVVIVIFMLITITFLSRSQYPDFQPLAGEPWLPLTNPVQLWVNSACLITASVTMHTAIKKLSAKLLNHGLLWLIIAVIWSGLFILGQFQVWLQLMQTGYGIAANPANSYFYLFTAVHGLHLLGGVVALVLVCKQFWLHTNLQQFTRNLSLCAVYWHFLLVVWLCLFALLTASAETYQTIAWLCGFD